jgi:hypothetical protein
MRVNSETNIATWVQERDAHNAKITQKVTEQIEAKGLSNFISRYLIAVERCGATVFNPEELLGTQPDLQPTPETVALRDRYLEMFEKFQIDFFKRYGTSVPPTKWASTFGFLAASAGRDISPEILTKMGIEL